ncbi:MAG: prolyl oligopeptidase family serine peptidase [Clostridia bacterium]|nr:prolyl oligopeptidase family serine peptidase [Clostridia bacterium]
MGFIQTDDLRRFAYTNEHLLTGRPVGVVPYFHGLGKGQQLKEDHAGGVELAKHNILMVYPYTASWGWANTLTIRYIDECIDLLLEKYGKDLPLCIAGGSMGGFTALVYTCTANRKIVACAADCPVCDLVAQFSDRPDLCQTIYTAYCDAPDFMAEIAARSPINRIENFPQIPYYINHGTKDTDVPKSRHSDPFVAQMRAAGHTVSYHTPPTAHCKYTDDSFARYYAFMEEAILRA